ncbi:MAG: 2-oxoacid:acceptor oxidoreductase family protein [Armatimonadetes bacterium]|nr:2-oxoacid:acceptor oxidoreductase family protein [Armatimonadota bacterium]
MRHDIFLAGLGGQGILFAGELLARAAVCEGLEVTWVPNYEPEVRGGAAMCTVVIANGRVGSPIVTRPHHLILMEQRAVDEYLSTAADGGLALVNSSLARADSGTGAVTIIRVPATELARSAGDERSANVVMLGALLALRPIVKLESVRHAIAEAAASRGPEAVRINLCALQQGADYASALDKCC